MPKRMENVRSILNYRNPGPSSLGGLVLLVGFAPLMLLLLISIIGIPLIPVAIVLFRSYGHTRPYNVRSMAGGTYSAVL